MELKQLQYVATAARTGSFTQAGTEENISESGLQKQIRRLEAELGVVLFERAGRSIQLTSAGQHLVARLEPVLAGFRGIEALAADLRVGRVGSVSISCHPHHVTRWLAGAIASFRKEHPSIRVEFRQSSLDTTEARGDYESLLQGRVDFAVGSSLGNPEMMSLWLYRTSGVVVFPDDHPLRHEATVDVSILRDELLICHPPGLWFRAELERACWEVGFLPRVEVETITSSLVALTRRGLGIGLLTDDNLWDRSEAPYPVLLDARGMPLARDNGLYWRRNATLPSPAKTFVDHVSKLVDDQSLTGGRASEHAAWESSNIDQHM